ncbi:MAG: phosphate ABC transporter substrate-binding protein [Collinsella sp.]|nr:phosphate ABC transporter substrate-binding protein [Collinsella sp.]
MRTTWGDSLPVVSRRGFLAAALGTVALSVLPACSSSTGSSQITVAGSTTCLPIAEVAAEVFTEKTGVRVLVSGLGSSAGIEAVSNGTADIATSSRGLNAEEQALGLTTIPIAHDGIAVIVNPDNLVSNLSVDQLRSIYSGAVTNWSEVGGEDLAIQLVNRDEASGTREAFKSIVMDGASFDRRAAVLSGTGQVRDVVSRSRGAIGYISLGFVESEFTETKVRALSVDDIEPSEHTIASGEYPISRDLFFFIKGEPSEDARDYIEYVLSDAMDSQIRDAGFIPVVHDASTGKGEWA